MFEGASDDEIAPFSEVLRLVDDTIVMSDTSKSALEGKPKLQAFFDHCCQIRHYSFCMKKCGSSECEVCKPVWMDSEHFKELHFLPDPMMGSDDHYKLLADVYDTRTTEDDCPSMIQRKKTKALTYSPSVQHACSTGIVIQCDECDKWSGACCSLNTSLMAGNMLNLKTLWWTYPTLAVQVLMTYYFLIPLRV